MLGRKPQANGHPYDATGDNGEPALLLTVVGNQARMDGKFDIADSIQIECEVSGALTVGGKLVIGEKGVVSARVQTVDAVIMGLYEGDMVATGNVEIATTGRVTGNLRTDSLVISRGGFFNGNVVKITDRAASGTPAYFADEPAALSGSRGLGNGARGTGHDGPGGLPYALEEDR